MGNAAKLALTVALALAAPRAAQETEHEAEWLARLFYPGLHSLQLPFVVSLDDVNGTTILDPAEHVEMLRERIDDGEEDADLELELVRALFRAEEGEEGDELLKDLWRRQSDAVERDPEDWEQVPQLGRVAFAIGARSRDPDTLNASLQLLTAARANGEDLWLARSGLAQLFLFHATMLRRAGEGERATQALQRARRVAEEALELDDEAMTSHALCFLIGLASAGEEEAGDASGRVVELARELSDARTSRRCPRSRVPSPASTRPSS